LWSWLISVSSFHGGRTEKRFARASDIGVRDARRVFVSYAIDAFQRDLEVCAP
jgi:hypothetical protein